MKIEEATNKSKQWRDRECNHPSIEKERFYNGFSTGDYVCSQCGHVVDEQNYIKPARTKATS